MENIYTVDEAAATLKVDAQTVRRMLQQGRIKGRKLGKAWRIPESALQSVVAVLPEDEITVEVDALLDATGVAARRAGYKTDEDVERLIAEVLAELGHGKPRQALRAARQVPQRNAHKSGKTKARA